MKFIHVESRHAEVVGRISVTEACRLCEVDTTFFEALVDEGVFEVESMQSVSEWMLKENDFAQLKKAARLHLDLGVNPPGIALVMELLVRLNR